MILKLENQLNLRNSLNYFKKKPLKESEKNIIIKTVKKYLNTNEVDLRRWN